MTTEQKLPIGDIPFHPAPSEAITTGVTYRQVTGVTYRQWLIGQALCGLCANERDQHSSLITAKNAITVADAVLAQL